jgi:hypothetical protein
MLIAYRLLIIAYQLKLIAYNIISESIYRNIDSDNTFRSWFFRDIKGFRGVKRRGGGWDEKFSIQYKTDTLKHCTKYNSVATYVACLPRGHLVEDLIFNLEKLGSRRGTEREEEERKKKIWGISKYLSFAASSHKTASLIPSHSSLPQGWFILLFCQFQIFILFSIALLQVL